ncbi:MAG TPA: DMT family transporter [Spirochaetia bacterium]|nr:DMT family transporter [Spirochaetia bacterium]
MGSAATMSTSNPRLGYTLAALNMVISGVAIYVNSLGVRMFSDSTLYTALKNSVVGIALLVPLVFSERSRAAWRRLGARDWLLLVAVALVGGSVSYALYFRGLQLTTPVTASLVDHTQFLLVALFAALFIGERFGPAVWIALAALFAGITLGIGAGTVRLDAGMPFVAAATLLFAADFVLMKYLLRTVSALTVMTFKMTLGSLLLFLFVAAEGKAAGIGELSLLQLGFAGITGLILLAFSVTSVLGLRHASATATTAIPAGSPIITTGLVVVSRHVEISPWRWLGLSLALLAVLAVFILGRRQEQGTARAARQRDTP